jgi:hypothetical protein
MDYQKLDSALAAALQEGEGGGEARFPVFLRLGAPPPSDATDLLRRLGVETPVAVPSIYPVELAAHDVDELSEKSWVSSIRLARASIPKQDGPHYES